MCKSCSAKKQQRYKGDNMLKIEITKAEKQNLIERTQQKVWLKKQFEELDFDYDSIYK